MPNRKKHLHEIRESFISSIKSALLWRTTGRATGIFKHVIIAAAIGLSVQLDIFYMTTALLGIFLFSWAQMLEVMAVPKLVELHQSGQIKAFNSLSGGMLTLCILFSLLITAATILGRSYISEVAWGFDEKKKKLLAEAIIWFAPVLLFLIPFQFMGSVFRAVRRFSIFYQAEFITGAVTLFLIYLFKDDPNVLFWSFSMGVSVAFFFLFVFYLRRYKVLGNPFSRLVKDALKIVPGLLILQCAHYFYILTDRIFMSFLANGSIGALAYGRTIAYSLEGLINIKGSFITIFSETDNPTIRNRIYNNLISLTVVISIPVTVYLLLLGKELIAVFLQRGMFKNTDTDLVFLAVTGFAWSLLPFFLLIPLEQIFQISGKINVMVVRKIGGLFVNLVLNYLFVFIFQLGIWGISVATSMTYWTLFLYAILAGKKIDLYVEWKNHIKWSTWMLIGTSCIAFVLIKAGFILNSIFGMLIQIGIFFLLSILIAYFYPGQEKELVRNAIKKALPLRR